MTNEPNWEDPTDPAWEHPDMIAHSAASLAALGREFADCADRNEELVQGVAAMRERGYELDAPLSRGVNDETNERVLIFRTRPQIRR